MEDVNMETESRDKAYELKDKDSCAKIAPESQKSNGENDGSDSSMCSSDFSFSDEETPEEKKEFKKSRMELIKKFGLDKYTKYIPKDHKMTPKVKYYTFDIKRKHREELPLRGWQKLKLYKNDSFLDDWINEPDEVSTMNIDRINVNDVTVQEFMERYEEPGIPAIING